MDIIVKTIPGFESNVQAMIHKYLAMYSSRIALIGIGLSIDGKPLTIADLIPNTTLNMSTFAHSILAERLIPNSEVFSENEKTVLSNEKYLKKSINLGSVSSISSISFITEEGSPLFLQEINGTLLSFTAPVSVQIDFYFKYIDRNYGFEEICTLIPQSDAPYIQLVGAESALMPIGMQANEGEIKITLPLPSSEKDNIENLIAKLSVEIFQNFAVE